MHVDCIFHSCKTQDSNRCLKLYSPLQRLCSAEDQAVVGSTLDAAAMMGPLVANSSFRGTGRQSIAALASKGAAAFASIPRGSIGPGSVAGQSIAGTAITALTAAGRPGSGAKSQISGVSAKSRASAAATASLGAMLAKDKLAQVRTVVCVHAGRTCIHVATLPHDCGWPCAYAAAEA
jgi:hypothetical protein